MDLLPAPEEVVAYVKAGAKGFIMKDATVEDFVGAVRSVARGADVMPPVLTGTLLSHIARDAVVHQRPEAADAVRMTKREQEVMQLITEGLDNKAIAQRLGVAGDTVKSHVRNILEKLTLHSRLAIAAHSRKGAATLRSPGGSPSVGGALAGMRGDREPAVQRQFLQNVPDVRLHRVARDAEPLCDGLVVQAVGD